MCAVYVCSVCVAVCGTCPIAIAPVNSPNMTVRKRTVVTPTLRWERGGGGAVLSTLLGMFTAAAAAECVHK